MIQRFCPCCEKEKALTAFIADFREKGKYLPLCRACTDRLVEEGKNERSLAIGVWTAAMANNVPMIKIAWEETISMMTKVDVRSPFAAYYKCLMNKVKTYSGVWESDLGLIDFIEPEQVEIEEPKFSDEELQQLFRTWGKFLDENGEIELEAYQYLENRYAQYTDSLTNLTNAMAMQYRNLCKAEWQKIKADEGGEISEIEKAQKLVNNLLSTLKLDDFAVSKSDVDRFIDRLIWRIEETEPAEEEDEKLYVDIAGYENMYNSMMRSMKNMIAGTRDYPDIPTEEM